MRPNRKAAKERLKSIKTRSELQDVLSALNLTDEEIEIAMLIFGRGWSLTRIQMEKGFSKRQLNKRLAKIYDKMI